MDTQNTKISTNRQKKIEIVSGLNEKLASAKAIVFTNYTGLTHKQLEELKRAIKPMKAEFVVAKNTLVQRAMEENKIKIADEKGFEGPTGTLLMQEDIVGPLKSLAKLIKELGTPTVKFGVMDGDLLTGEQVLKISTLPTREVLLAQVVITLKSPISGLHRALNWNLQKIVLTLGAVVKSKPAEAAAPQPETTEAAAVSEPTPAVEKAPAAQASQPEPETILDETKQEKLAEQPQSPAQAPVSEPEPETILAESKEEKALEKPEEPKSENTKVSEEVN